MSDAYEKYQEELDAMLSEDTLSFSYAELKEKKKDELVELCRDYDLKVSGNKEELIQRIYEFKMSNVISARGEIKFVGKDSDEGSSGDTEEPAKATRI